MCPPPLYYYILDCPSSSAPLHYTKFSDTVQTVRARPPFVALRQLVVRIPHRTFLCASVQSEEIRSHLNLSLSCLKIDSQCVFIHLLPQPAWSRRDERGHGDREGQLHHHYVHTEKMCHVPLTSVCCPHSKDTNCSRIYIYDTFPLYNWMILMRKLSMTSLIGI